MESDKPVACPSEIGNDCLNPPAAVVTPGKHDYVAHSSCHDSLNHNVNSDSDVELKLTIEYAELEYKSAQAMQRAAAAKKVALDAIQRKKDNSFNSSENLGRHVDSDVHVNFPLHNIQESDSGRDSSMSVLEKLLIKMEMPKCEMPYFDGSSANYVSFFRQFDQHIERQVLDNGQRLTYLFHYCVGQAKEAIRGCLMYPADVGYSKARKTLYTMFGQEHCIVRGLLEDIMTTHSVKFDSNELLVFSNKISNCVDTLEQLSYVADLNSVSTIEKVLSKLPKSMTWDWIKHTDHIYMSGREPSFRDLSEFIAGKARLASNRYSHLVNDRSSVGASSMMKPDGKTKRLFAFTSDFVCVVCSESHDLSECSTFSSFSTKDRWKTVLSHNLCFLCFKRGHQARACRSKNICKTNGCIKAHHSLLHQNDDVVSLSCKSTVGDCVSLGIIPVRVIGEHGHTVVYAMLDSGSDTSLISQSVADKLGLRGRQTELNVCTALGAKSQRCTEFSLRLQSVNGRETVDVSRIYTVPKVLAQSVTVPNAHQLSKWNHLCDIGFETASSFGVDVLLGLDVPEAHWIFEQRRGCRKEPHADLTMFGWVLRGPMKEVPNKQRRAFTMVQNDNIQANSKSIHVHEGADVQKSTRGSYEENEVAFEMVVQRLEVVEGRFCIGFPWKTLKQVVLRPDAPVDELSLWSQWNQRIPKVESICMPSCYLHLIDYSSYDLRTFFDASETEWRAAAYLRCVSNGQLHCTLLSTESRVAPLKQVTIPRFKLSAATDVYSFIQKELELTSASVQFRADSSIVLRYLHSGSAVFATFVANRVAQVFGASRLSQWGFIEGNQNPAGSVSREFMHDDETVRWWLNNPLFLQDPDKIRSTVPNCDIPLSLFETKVMTQNNLTVTDYRINVLLNRYLTWMKLLKCVVWLHRFTSYLTALFGKRVSVGVRLGFLNVDELRGASEIIIKLVQVHSYYKELVWLQKNRSVNTNRLRERAPILMDEVMCVSGRLRWSTWSVTSKDPLILSGRHPVTEVVTQYYHETQGHVRYMQVLFEMHKELWVLQGGAAVLRIVRVLASTRLILLRVNTSFGEILSFPSLCILMLETVQVLTNTCWKRWKMECLSTSKLWHEWYLKSGNLKQVDSVLVKRESAHRNQWPIGLITKVFPGSENHVREVMVEPLSGEFRRDVRRLCLLEGMK